MEIVNAKIVNTSISMADHGVLTFYIIVDGGSWKCNIGNYVIGHGYLGSKEFKAESGAGLVAMMRIMDVVGVGKWEDLEGKYCRIKIDSWGDSVTTIGNILTDKWFDIKDFFESYERTE